MAYISYNKLWESEFDNIVSKGDKLQDLNFDHKPVDFNNETISFTCQLIKI